MEYGLVLHNYGPAVGPGTLLREVKAAERLGFHSVWTTDHVLLPVEDGERFGRLLEALITLAFLAGRTERVRLGVSSLVLPQRHPVLVAKQVAALDVLSGGRAMLALGVGWSEGEYANMGVGFRDRGRRMDEALRVLRLLLASSGERLVDFEGSYYRFRRGMFAPPPAQAGGPPLWVAGNSPAAIRRAARLGDGWHPTGLEPEQLQDGVDRLRELAGGRTVQVSLRLRLSFGTREVRAPLKGSTEEIAESLRRYAQAGLGYAVIDFLERSSQAREAAMERFVLEVAPVVESQKG